MKRSSLVSIPNASDGAPPVEISDPSFAVSCARSEIPPTAASTSGSARTSSSRPSSNGGGSPKSVVNASLPVTTTSVPAYASVKTVANARSIVSVST